MVLIPPEIKGDIAGLQEVMGKIVLDILLPIPGADNEFIEAVMEIGFHDMPQNGALVYLYHRLGAVLGFLTDAGAEAAG